MRTFCPKPVAKIILNVGGASALLGLIAMATDVEGLYASVKALVCATKSNDRAQKEMERIRGYQVMSCVVCAWCPRLFPLTVSIARVDWCVQCIFL